MFRNVTFFVILLVMVFFASDVYAAGLAPVAWWKFDIENQKTVLDSATRIDDEIKGNFKYVKGISGKALKLDGFTTQIIRSASRAPKIQDSFTIESWIAIAAYPWNWCTLVAQQKEEQAGYCFGIGPRGEFGLELFVNGQWQTCKSEDFAVPLHKWVHIVAMYKKDNGVTLFLNSQPAGKLSVPGKPVFAPNAELRIGMNYQAVKPSHIHREVGTLPYWFSFDGIMDEIRIYDNILSAKVIKKYYTANAPTSAPDLPPRRMPRGPAGPDYFGANYTKLKYYEEWDALWRIGPDPDVVVKFEGSPVKVVFWRGTRYSPAWVSENDLWMADQSVETWNGTEGCYEHMQDRHCKYSHVRIIENSDARVVVHWRYAPICAQNLLWKPDEKTGWECWIDEYYYIYPDRMGIRKITWKTGTLGRPRQFQESIPFCHPGQLQGDVIHPDFVTIANLKGETQTFSYVENPPKKNNKPIPKSPNIQRHNFKSKNKPFIIFEPGNRMRYLIDRNIESLSRPGSCCHWPVGQAYCDGRTSQAADRPTSFLGFPISSPVIHENHDNRSVINSIYGMTDRPFNDLVTVARSWAQAPIVKIISKGYTSQGYDMSQRIYVFSAEPVTKSSLTFELAASVESPVFNPAFIINNWGKRGAFLKIDGEKIPKGKNFRLGHKYNLEGFDLVVWIKKESTKPCRISITPAND